MCQFNLKVDMSEFKESVDRLISVLQANKITEVPDANYFTSDLVFTNTEDKMTLKVSAGNNLNKFISDIETHAIP